MKENTTSFIEEEQEIEVGAHVCAVHESSNAILNTLARAFITGLARNERCALIAPDPAAAELRRVMGSLGLDVASAEADGRLVLLTDRDSLLKGGVEFDPDHLLDAIKALFGETVEAGYAGLRLSADIPWLTRDVPGGERAMEFEQKADEIINVPGVPLLAICQYRLGELEPEDTLEILERHPLTIVGGRVHRNENYPRPYTNRPRATPVPGS